MRVLKKDTTFIETCGHFPTPQNSCRTHIPSSSRWIILSMLSLSASVAITSRAEQRNETNGRTTSNKLQKEMNDIPVTCTIVSDYVTFATTWGDFARGREWQRHGYCVWLASPPSEGSALVHGYPRHLDQLAYTLLKVYKPATA